MPSTFAPLCLGCRVALMASGLTRRDLRLVNPDTYKLEEIPNDRFDGFGGHVHWREAWFLEDSFTVNSSVLPGDVSERVGRPTVGVDSVLVGRGLRQPPYGRRSDRGCGHRSWYAQPRSREKGSCSEGDVAG